LSEAFTGRLKGIPVSDRNDAPRGGEIFLKTPEKLLNFKEDPPLFDHDEISRRIFWACAPLFSSQRGETSSSHRHRGPSGRRTLRERDEASRLHRAPGVRRSCFDEASAFAITRERRLARIDGLPHLSEAGGAAIFSCTRLAWAAVYPFGTVQNLGLSSKKIASIVLHSSLNIKFSIANGNNETKSSLTSCRKTIAKCRSEFIYA
jgi:hypothetical protein